MSKFYYIIGGHTNYPIGVCTSEGLSSAASEDPAAKFFEIAEGLYKDYGNKIYNLDKNFDWMAHSQTYDEIRRTLPMVKRHSWAEFRNSGLLWLVNTILHTFGWAIVVKVDDKTGEITDAYPARVRFRGFDEKTNTAGYIKVSEYMSKNAADLLSESLDEGR
jgi:hypothetical protein